MFVTQNPVWTPSQELKCTHIYLEQIYDFTLLWAATNSRLNSPAVNYYSCQLQGHMWPTYTQQGVSSCDTYSFVCEAGTGKLRKTRRKNSTYIMRPYMHSLCSKCGIMLLQVSSAQNVFFFPPRVAMKKPTRAVLVLFPLCHANFLGCLIAPQRQLRVRFFRKGSAQVSRSYTRDSHTWLDEVRVPFHFFKMWMDEVYVPLNVCFSSLRMDDCRITLFFHHYCADYHKKNYL